MSHKLQCSTFTDLVMFLCKTLNFPNASLHPSVIVSDKLKAKGNPTIVRNNPSKGEHNSFIVTPCHGRFCLLQLVFMGHLSILNKSLEISVYTAVMEP